MDRGSKTILTLSIFLTSNSQRRRKTYSAEDWTSVSLDNPTKRKSLRSLNYFMNVSLMPNRSFYQNRLMTFAGHPLLRSQHGWRLLNLTRKTFFSDVNIWQHYANWKEMTTSSSQSQTKDVLSWSSQRLIIVERCVPYWRINPNLNALAHQILRMITKG